MSETRIVSTPFCVVERRVKDLCTAVNFSEFNKEPSGQVGLIGRIKYVFPCPIV